MCLCYTKWCKICAIHLWRGWGKNLSMFELGMCPWPLRTIHHYNLFGGQLEAHFVFTFEWMWSLRWEHSNCESSHFKNPFLPQFSNPLNPENVQPQSSNSIEISTLSESIQSWKCDLSNSADSFISLNKPITLVWSNFLFNPIYFP